MSRQDSARILSASLAAMVLFGLVGRKDSAYPMYKRVWAIGVLGLFLSLLTDFVPEVGGPLALLFALGFVARGGDRITGVITNAVGQKAPATTGG